MIAAGDAGAYERHRAKMAEASRENVRAASEIGELPEVENPQRRKACEFDLFLFLTTYFPRSTGKKPFSDDHRRIIARIQRCILQGGRLVEAVFRGFAKTTVCENSTIWAIANGHRKAIPIIGADQTAADDNIDSIKRELESNDLLAADFPEMCYPVRRLEGRAQRAGAQTYRGQPTHIEWTSDKVVLPTIPGAPSSGAVIWTRGMTSGIRGLKHKRADGEQQRPDFAFIDDPQTDDSAASASQCARRIKIIKKVILGSGGHERDLAVVMAATVIEPGDLVEHFLDAEREPAWQGERVPMMKRQADLHDKFWLGEYAAVRNGWDRADPDDQKRAARDATALYLSKREEADRGCVITWEHCYHEDEGEVSAIQHAYNKLIDDGPEVFASECQNEPLSKDVDHELPTAEEIAARVNRHLRGVVPNGCNKLTAMIDVHQNLLYYAVCGWEDDFTGAVVDYGVFPEQVRPYFTLRDARPTLQTLNAEYAKMGLEGQLFAGLDTLSRRLLSREWRRDDGVGLRIERCNIDAGWGETTPLVYKFCRESEHATVLMPSHGRGVTAGDKPLVNPKDPPKVPKRGERRSPQQWIVGPGERNQLHVTFDSNSWKSFLFARLAVARGDRGALALFGHEARAHYHFADHLKAEYRVLTEGRERTLWEWKAKPGKPDNHWFDCLVGCCVAASVQGVNLPQHQGEKQRAKRAMRLSSIQASKR